MLQTSYKTCLTGIVQDGYGEPNKRKNIVSILKSYLCIVQRKKYETRLTSNVEDDRDEPKKKNM